MNNTQKVQIAQKIEMQQQLVAQKAQELKDEQEKLNQFIIAQETCLKAEAAQKKIEEGKRELEEAIASMPPEIAAIYQGYYQNVPHQDVPPEPKPATKENTKPAPEGKVTKQTPVSDAAVVMAFDKIINNKSILRIGVPIIQEAAKLAGVSPEGTKNTIADRIRAVPGIASMVGITRKPEKKAKFKPGDRVQDPWGRIGTVEKTEKKPEGGECGSALMTCETNTSSDVQSPVSNLGTQDVAAAPPENTVLGMMPESTHVAKLL